MKDFLQSVGYIRQWPNKTKVHQLTHFIGHVRTMRTEEQGTFIMGRTFGTGHSGRYRTAKRTIHSEQDRIYFRIMLESRTKLSGALQGIEKYSTESTA